MSVERRGQQIDFRALRQGSSFEQKPGAVGTAKLGRSVKDQDAYLAKQEAKRLARLTARGR